MWAPRELYLAVGIGLWLCGYFVVDGWEHRRAVRWLVPILLLNCDILVRTMRESRWLWAVAGLLAFQALSRWWSVGNEPVSNGFDVLAVLALLISLVAIGRREDAGNWMLGGLAVLAGGVALFSLAGFYGSEGRHLATDRLRNVLIYENGLNPVLTGMLCGFGAVAAAWFAGREQWVARRGLWLACLAVLIFSLMATQSRGAMLAGGAGLAVLALFLRKAVLPAVVTCAVTVGTYFLLVARSDADLNLIERGSTGRLEIYHWFLERVSAMEVLIGSGMSADVTIAKVELGWFVDHPHSSYLTQFVLTGALGLALLLFVIGWPVLRALGAARRQEALWLALLASGAVAVLFDCGQMFSLYSAPRIEFLLVAVPAALCMGRVGAGD